MAGTKTKPQNSKKRTKQPYITNIKNCFILIFIHICIFQNDFHTYCGIDSCVWYPIVLRATLVPSMSTQFETSFRTSPIRTHGRANAHTPMETNPRLYRGNHSRLSISALIITKYCVLLMEKSYGHGRSFFFAQLFRTFLLFCPNG